MNLLAFTIHHALLTLAQASPAPGPTGGSPFGSMFVPFICIGVVFYFLIIRPQQKKQKQHVAMMSSLKTGDKVVTSGGIHGLISNVKDSTVILKVADNVKIEVDKGGIVTIAKRESQSAAA